MRLKEDRTDTILLVCGSEHESAYILSKLFEAGFNVVGPAPNASLALALAAQTTPTIALVATKPTGRRGATELADELMRTWGIPSWVRKAINCEPGVEDHADWRAPHDRIAPIREILAPHGAEGRTA